MEHLTVCYYHVTYAFWSESTLYSCLNVKQLLIGCGFESCCCHKPFSVTTEQSQSSSKRVPTFKDTSVLLNIHLRHGLYKGVVYKVDFTKVFKFCFYPFLLQIYLLVLGINLFNCSFLKNSSFQRNEHVIRFSNSFANLIWLMFTYVELI